jgi:hypothetical protein
MPPPDNSLAALLPSDLRLLSSSQIASLWSSYGHIYRLKVASAGDVHRPHNTLILKSIHPPSLRTGTADEPHLRKLLSYEVERFFYQNLSSRLPAHVKVAKSYPLTRNVADIATSGGDLLLDDLSPEYPHPARGSLGLEATQCVLRWLSGFHAAFWNVHLASDDGSGTPPLNLVPPPLQISPESDTNQLEEAGRGVWQQGTYWYLDTRREEMSSVDESGDEGWLVPWAEKVNVAIARSTASLIRSRQVNEALALARKKHATLVHGDVKGANIVFSHSPFRKPDPSAPALACALYDLQYVGVNPPTHDLVYFLGTSVSNSLLGSGGERDILDYYFGELSASLPAGVSYPRKLFVAHWKLSIVDWVRFMAGWGFWGNDRWATKRAKEIVQGWETGGFESLLQTLNA